MSILNKKPIQIMKTKNVVVSLAVAAFVVAVLSAFAPPAASKFKVDSKASSLVWTGKKLTGQHSGNVPVSAGKLVVENKVLKQGTFEIDLSNLTVTDIADKEGNAKLVGHLKSDDFFAVSKYPKATFVITSVTPKSGNEYTVKGNLTIKGKANPIEFPATIKNDGKQLTATAKIVVDRAKYDVRYGLKSFFDDLGDKVIYDEFDLDLKLVANLQAGV